MAAGPWSFEAIWLAPRFACEVLCSNGCSVPSRAGALNRFPEMYLGDAHAPGSGGGAGAERLPEPVKGRKHAARPDFFSQARRRPFRTVPHSVSLSPPPTSRAEPLILPEELRPWPQQTGSATCNLPSQRASFQRTAPVSRGLEGTSGEAGCGVHSNSWNPASAAGRIWEVSGPLCTSYVCNMGIIIAFTA